MTSTLLPTQPTRAADDDVDMSDFDEPPSLFPAEDADEDTLMVEPSSLLRAVDKGKAPARDADADPAALDFAPLKHHGNPAEKQLRRVPIPPRESAPSNCTSMRALVLEPRAFLRVSMVLTHPQTA